MIASAHGRRRMGLEPAAALGMRARNADDIVIPVAADSYVSWGLGEGDDPAVDWAQSQS